MTDDVEKVRKLVGWDGPIEKGDVVYLKSGSPGLTVSSLTKDSVECLWFDKARTRSQTFPRVMLTKQPTSPDGRRAGVLLVGELPPDEKAN